MNRARWFLSVPASVALHALGLVMLLILFGWGRSDDVLFVDLTKPEESLSELPPTASARRPDAPPAATTPGDGQLSRPAARASARPTLGAQRDTRSSPSRDLPADPSVTAPSAERMPRQGEAARSMPGSRDAVTMPSTPAPSEVLTPEAKLAPPPPAPEPPAPAAPASPPRPSAATIEPVSPDTGSRGAATEGRERGAQESSGARVTADASPALVGSGGAVVTPGAGPTTGGGGTDRSSGEAGGGPRSTAAVSGGGASGSGEAEYASYLALVRQRIQEALHYPLAARRRSLTGTVQLEILVQPSGAISEVKVVSSSSHQVLDQAALEAVRRLPPLRFPAGLTPRVIRARLPVVFELR